MDAVTAEEQAEAQVIFILHTLLPCIYVTRWSFPSEQHGCFFGLLSTFDLK
jgi:hypothetical protein